MSHSRDAEPGKESGEQHSQSPRRTPGEHSEAEGLVEVVPSDADQRIRVARLTSSGADEVGELDRVSDDLVAAMLTPLDGRRRAQLLDAVATVDRLLTAGMVTIEVVDPRSDDAGLCMESYFAELDVRFDDGFDQGLSTSVDYTEFSEPTGLLLIARLRGQPIGCGGLKFHDDEPPDIKRMWIAPSAWGLGVGRRLLTALEHEARRHGARTVRLETNRNLGEALELYRARVRRGRPFNDERYAHHWFEKPLTGDSD